MFARRVRLFVACVAVLGACAVNSSNATASSTVSGTITVSAAASLRDSFVEMGKAFRRANPKVKVRFNFASSSVLVSQVLAGAPADVVAFADLATMDKLVAAGAVVATPKVFAKNSMIIAVKPGNPQGVKQLADLSRVGVISLCIATAPCGVYAKTILSRASVSLPESSVTRGVDVAATLAQVATGDAQAGIVYATDVLAAGKTVMGIPIPRSLNVTAMYPIAPVKSSGNRATASAFVDFVTSAQGWSIMKSFGFVRP